MYFEICIQNDVCMWKINHKKAFFKNKSFFHWKISLITISFGSNSSENINSLSLFSWETRISSKEWLKLKNKMGSSIDNLFILKIRKWINFILKRTSCIELKMKQKKFNIEIATKNFWKRKMNSQSLHPYHKNKNVNIK